MTSTIGLTLRFCDEWYWYIHAIAPYLPVRGLWNRYWSHTFVNTAIQWLVHCQCHTVNLETVSLPVAILRSLVWELSLITSRPSLSMSRLYFGVACRPITRGSFVQSEKSPITESVKTCSGAHCKPPGLLQQCLSSDQCRQSASSAVSHECVCSTHHAEAEIWTHKKYVLSNSESVQCNFFIFDYVTFIQFKICCCVQNFLKSDDFYRASAYWRAILI